MQILSIAILIISIIFIFTAPIFFFKKLADLIDEK